MAWYQRVWNVVRPGRHWRELDEELAFHVAERTDALIAAGMDPEAAAREARRRFGNPTAQRERTREEGIVVWLDSLLADVRYAIRGLARNPGFALVAILSLALGIGANTAIFSLMNTLLLKSLPVPAPEELVRVTMGQDGGEWFTNPQWEAIRDGNDAFDGLFAYADNRLNLSTAGYVDYAQAGVVSGGFFPTLGIAPSAGRLLGPEDDFRGCPAIAVLSHGFAHREYGGAAAAVGRTVTLDGHPFQAVGVATPGFTGIEVGAAVEVYVPLCSLPILRDNPEHLEHRSAWYLQLVGRPAGGASPAAVRAALNARAPSIFEATLPQEWAASDQARYLERRFDVEPAATGLSDLRERYGTALMVLLGVVGVVLLVACANIANLMLARAAARQRESAIRRAIGAGRRRLIRQALTESLLLSLMGAAVGTLFAVWTSRLLVRFLSTRQNPVWLDLSLDLRVLGFIAAVATATGLLFGLLPAWRAARVSPQSAMRTGGRGVVSGPGRAGGRTLVVGQVALSLALVVTAGLLLGSFRALSTLDPGFDREGLLLVYTTFGAPASQDQPDRRWRELLERLRAIPGVSSASASSLTPVGRGAWNERLLLPGHTPPDGDYALAYFNEVSEGYFATMGTPLLAGRDIRPSDGDTFRGVAVINQAMVDEYFAGENPLGRTFRTSFGDQQSHPIEVVGVVRSAKYRRLNEPLEPTVFVPISGARHLAYELRVQGRPAAFRPLIQHEAEAVSADVMLDMTTMERQLSESLARPRLLATLSGFFGAAALLLAVIGLYGTLSYNVTRRRPEIGIRMALGAPRPRVLASVVGEAGWLVAAGLGLGLALALGGTRFISSFLYGVEPTDPATLAGATAILAVAALCASLLPAWRAARVDPVETLREEG